MTGNLIIGLVGQKGAGKECVGNIILELWPSRSIQRVRSSDVLFDTLQDWGLTANRRNLQRLALVMDHEFGTGTLTTAVGRRMQMLQADVIIFDGIRWETDLL